MQASFDALVAHARRSPAWDLPLPGAGATAERHRRLADIAKADLDLGRLAEAHTDALAILAEAGRPARVDVLYGVWASDGPQSKVRAELSDAGWQLRGIKQYCSGAPLAGAALVTAHSEAGLMLFDVAIGEGIDVQPSVWASQGLAASATVPVTFDLQVTAEPLGGADWYLTRPGFWHGALGPAACWAGGALALVQAALTLNRRDAHSRAHLGALQALQWNLYAVLKQAGDEIDATVDDTARAHQRALIARHLIERMCTEILDRFGRATGPQLLAFDEQIAKTHAGLAVYIRQCHGERDLASLADSSQPQ